MIIQPLTEENEILKNLIIMTKSKLTSMQNHLEAIVSKKLRLDLEIKNLTKQISKYKKEQDTKIKFHLKTEGLIQEGSEVLNHLLKMGALQDIRDLDRLEFRFSELLQEIEEKS